MLGVGKWIPRRNHNGTNKTNSKLCTSSGSIWKFCRSMQVVCFCKHFFICTPFTTLIVSGHARISCGAIIPILDSQFLFCFKTYTIIGTMECQIPNWWLTLSDITFTETNFRSRMMNLSQKLKWSGGNDYEGGKLNQRVNLIQVKQQS